MLRVAITGPESTGKSTLASFLSRYFDAPLSEEFARSYLMKSDGEYSFETLSEIARGQLQNQYEADQFGTELVFYDTDLLVVKVWSNQKFGRCATDVLDCCSKQKVDLYLLPHFDIPWEDDSLRESPTDRASLFTVYLSEIQRLNIPFLIVRGNFFDRNFEAIKSIREYLR